MVGITDTDSLGMWAKGNTNGYSYGTNGYPTNTYICDSSSYNTAYGNVSALGNASISNDTGTTGLYTTRSIVHTHSGGSLYTQPWIDIVFSSGLGTAKGFVIQAYAPTFHFFFNSLTTNLWASQHNPLCRMTCNGVSATFAPKGYYGSDSNTQVGTVTGNFFGYDLINGSTTNAGHVAYPTQYDLTNTTDMPFRFYPCMVAGLAYYIGMKRAPERMQALKLLYEDEFKRAADEDGQRTSVYLTPQSYYPTGGGY